MKDPFLLQITMNGEDAVAEEVVADSIPLDSIALDSTIADSSGIAEQATPSPPTPLEEALANDYLMYFAVLLVFALLLVWVFLGFRKMEGSPEKETSPDLYLDRMAELKSDASNLVKVALILIGLGLFESY